jgi:hypothetical protein
MRFVLVFLQHKYYPAGVERYPIDATRLTNCERGGVRVGDFVYTNCEVDGSTGVLTAVPGIVLGLDGGGDRKRILVLVLPKDAGERYVGLFALTDVYIERDFACFESDAPQAKRPRSSQGRGRRNGVREHRR